MTDIGFLRRIFRRISLKQKLMAVMLVVTGTVLLMATLAFFIDEVYSFRKTARENLLVLAKIIAGNTTAAVLFNDRDAAGHTLDRLADNAHVLSAYVILKDGEVFASYVRKGGVPRHSTVETVTDGKTPRVLPETLAAVVRESESILDADLDLETVYPYFLDGQQISTVVIISDLDELIERVKNYLAAVGFILSGAAFLGFLISSRLQRVISDPVVRLVATMDRVTRHQDYTLRETVDSGDELGSLAKGFNQMLEQIELRDARLLQNQEELKKRVARKTAHLAQANEQLQQEIEERKRHEGEILDYQQRLLSLSFELSLAEDRERDRIAGELHDHVGQNLLLAKMKLDMLTSQLASGEGRLDEAEEVGALVDQSVQDVRSLTFQIRPPLLATAGLEAAVMWLGEEFRENYGIEIDCVCDKEPKPLKYEIRSILYQSVRELLLNAVKHSGARQVHVGLAREAGFIVIVVEDRGSGFDIAQLGAKKAKEGGFGLFNIQQRLEYLGGGLTLESEPGQGTRATLRAPLE